MASVREASKKRMSSRKPAQIMIPPPLVAASIKRDTDSYPSYPSPLLYRCAHHILVTAHVQHRVRAVLVVKERNQNITCIACVWISALCLLCESRVNFKRDEKPCLDVSCQRVRCSSSSEKQANVTKLLEKANRRLSPHADASRPHL